MRGASPHCPVSPVGLPTARISAWRSDDRGAGRDDTIPRRRPRRASPATGVSSGTARAYEGDWLRDRRRSRRTTNVATRLMSTLVTTGDHFGGRPPPPRRKASGSMNTARHLGQRLTPSPRAIGCMAVPSFGHGHADWVSSVTISPSPCGALRDRLPTSPDHDHGARGSWLGQSVVEETRGSDGRSLYPARESMNRSQLRNSSSRICGSMMSSPTSSSVRSSAESGLAASSFILAA